MIFTCGHSTRSFQDLIELLQPHGITLLVDVRAIPRSRFHPWFNQKYLETHLPLKYLWKGDILGGKNAHLIPEAEFERGIQELIELSKTETVCIMCSEGQPTPTKWRKEGCHRWYAITPTLEQRGIDVVHL
jgi:uncharacterized protein (DUF488 family)